MMTYSMCETEPFQSTIEPLDVPTQRYAWLEHEAGEWHFLMNLFEAPGQSVRSWADEQSALEELETEGWVVVYPYNEQITENRKPEGHACGYGLMWIDHGMIS